MCPHGKRDLSIFSGLNILQCGRNEVSDTSSLPEAPCSPFQPASLRTPFSPLFPNLSSISAWSTPIHPSKPQRKYHLPSEISQCPQNRTRHSLLCESRYKILYVIHIYLTLSTLNCEKQWGGKEHEFWGQTLRDCISHPLHLQALRPWANYSICLIPNAIPSIKWGR